MILPRCTTKQLVWILIFISVFGFLHIWYITRAFSFVTNLRKIIARARSKFLEDISDFPIQHTKHVMFWNGYSNLKDRDIQCQAPGDSCIYRMKNNNTDSEDMFVYAIIFNEMNFNLSDKPTERWDDQVYIFWCLEPSVNTPACKAYNERFFNWTLTYRLDSTVVWPHFVVQDRNTSEIVAPNKSVIWKENHEALKPLVKRIINGKTKSIAWVTSNCSMNPKGRAYMHDLQSQLSRLGVFIDVYGPCSNLKCSFYNNCDRMVRRNYYFYIAFEDYITEDYVSDKVLHAYENYAVPIVYGGANYSWFLPPGSYLNAMEMHPYSLANKVKQAVENAELYEDFFRWTNLYKINAYPINQHPLCKLCAALNVESKKPIQTSPSNKDF